MLGTARGLRGGICQQVPPPHCWKKRESRELHGQILLLPQPPHSHRAHGHHGLAQRGLPPPQPAR